jgi:hypothetical protein
MQFAKLGLGLAMAAAMLQPLSAWAADDGPNRCIQVNLIDHTRVLDDQTILFYLRGGEVLRNTLNGRCVGLRLATRGFTYVALDNTVCGNLQSVRLNDTGEVCELGSFTPEPKASHQ